MTGAPMICHRANSYRPRRLAPMRRWGNLVLVGLLFASGAVLAQERGNKVSKYDEAAAKKLAVELLVQVQQGLKGGEDAESCYSKFSLPPADPLHKSLAAMTEQNIKDVELFDDGAYLEMKLVGESRADKIAVMVRLA